MEKAAFRRAASIKTLCISVYQIHSKISSRSSPRAAGKPMAARKARKTWKFISAESRKEDGRFVRIAEDMLESLAWRQLDVYEQTLYLAMKNKFRVNSHGMDNGNNISFTYSEGRKLMTPRRFTKSIDHLIEVGLIDLLEQWRHTRKSNIYGLSPRWHDYGTDKFREKKRIKARRFT
ncbi:MAG: hypothetical protein ACYC0L_05615 [Thermoleophilia bacterium]